MTFTRGSNENYDKFTYSGNKSLAQDGTILLNKVEAKVKQLGATLPHLDTFDWQAKEFYLKHGYEVFGVLDDCTKGHKRYYVKKALEEL